MSNLSEPTSWGHDHTFGLLDGDGDQSKSVSFEQRQSGMARQVQRRYDAAPQLQRQHPRAVVERMLTVTRLYHAAFTASD